MGNFSLKKNRKVSESLLGGAREPILGLVVCLPSVAGVAGRLASEQQNVRHVEFIVGQPRFAGAEKLSTHV